MKYISITLHTKDCKPPVQSIMEPKNLVSLVISNLFKFLDINAKKINYSKHLIPFGPFEHTGTEVWY
jgi:hypothetical protein